MKINLVIFVPKRLSAMPMKTVHTLPIDKAILKIKFSCVSCSVHSCFMLTLLSDMSSFVVFVIFVEFSGVRSALRLPFFEWWSQRFSNSPSSFKTYTSELQPSNKPPKSRVSMSVINTIVNFLKFISICWI